MYDSQEEQNHFCTRLQTFYFKFCCKVGHFNSRWRLLDGDSSGKRCIPPVSWDFPATPPVCLCASTGHCTYCICEIFHGGVLLYPKILNVSLCWHTVQSTLLSCFFPVLCGSGELLKFDKAPLSLVMRTDTLDCVFLKQSATLIPAASRAFWSCTILCHSRK